MVGQALTLGEMADGIKLVKRNLTLEHQMQMARETLREQADVRSIPRQLRTVLFR
ncbi:hypothetical protein GOB82_07955 [Acetobacter farinalis]|nr:hypothetical protein [Acetobacter farinalis]